MKAIIKQSLLYSQILFLLLLPISLQLTEYLHPIVIVVVWILLTFIVLFGIYSVKKVIIQLPKPVLHVSILLYSIGLLTLLFFRPNDQHYETLNLIPFETISFYLTGNGDFLISLYNLGGNICLFIPFGLYYRYVSKTPAIKRLLIMSLCSIITIESFQFFSKRGSLDIDDLLLNVFGVCLGYIIQPVFKSVLEIK